MLKKWCLTFFIRKVCSSLSKITILFEARIKPKKIHRLLEFNQLQWLKPYLEFNTQKRTQAEKSSGKDGKALYKLMSNAIYCKTMEDLRNRIDVRFSNKKRLLKSI